MGLLNVSVIKFLYRNEREKNESYHTPSFHIIDRGKNYLTR